MAACVRADIDEPVNIPAVQATIIERARQFGYLPQLFFSAQHTSSRCNASTATKTTTPYRVAIIGAGPAGLACAAVLCRAVKTVEVEIFEKRSLCGGAVRTIPLQRLPSHYIDADFEFIRSICPNLRVHLNTSISSPLSLLASSDAHPAFDAVCIAAGLGERRNLGIPNEEHILGIA